MTDSFFQRLEKRCKEVDSLLCIGLDPHPNELPSRSATAARDFCFRLIDSTSDVAAAFKPNSAFFEVYGAEGFRALKEVIDYARKSAPVILDAKRGDIESTSEAYAEAAFKTFGADALTVSPYLGKDSIDPFIADPEHGIFLLCKTSNPGADDLQNQLVSGKRLYAQVASLAEHWNSSDNVGLVVGATYPEVLAELRSLVPDVWFLAPGVGTQGGELKAAIEAGLRQDGLGLLLPISRGISQAKDPAAKARQFQSEINEARSARPKTSKAFANRMLADDLLRLNCVQFGDFTLKSGKHSPFYVDLRRLVGDPATLTKAAVAYVDIMRNLKFDRVAGLPYAALPIATAISLQSRWPLIYPRKESKDYGTKAVIEGPYKSGETVVVVDDLITTGESKVEAIEKLETVGLKVTDIVVLIDRRSGEQKIAGRDIKVHAVFQLDGLIDYWRGSGAISRDQYTEISEYLLAS